MGHVPILSENKDFPVNPSLNAAENCIDAVRNEADIFVLIIGGRYGYKMESGKSITNTEFLTALQKGIPIYTFTLKRVIHILPVWKKNRQMDLSEVVDDNRVFEFIEDVRDKKGVWNFEFETAQDVLEILKPQLSILFQHSLKSYQRIQEIDNDLASRITSKALKLLLEKSDQYELLFFLQVMQDEIDKYKYLKNDCDHSVIIKPGALVSDPITLINWQQEKLNQLEKLIDSLNNLFKAYEYYYREPGTPADLEGLYYVGHRYGKLYASLLEWVIDVRSTNTPVIFTKLVSVFSELPSNVIIQLEAYPNKCRLAIMQALERVNSGSLQKDSKLDLTLHLSLDEGVQTRLNEEMNKLEGTLLSAELKNSFNKWAFTKNK